ncbi:hypothetical protein GQ457_15G017190 [Hibiscus cannabinus]
MAPKKGDNAKAAAAAAVATTTEVPATTEVPVSKATLESMVTDLQTSVKDAVERLDVVDDRLDELENKRDELKDDVNTAINKAFEGMEKQGSAFQDALATMKEEFQAKITKFETELVVCKAAFANGARSKEPKTKSKGLPDNEGSWEPAEALWQFRDKIVEFHSQDPTRTLPDLVGESVTDHEVAAIQVAQEALHRLLGLSNPSKLARPLENARGPTCSFLVTTHAYVILVDQDEPKTYQEAVSSPESKKWLEAMRSEMDSMSENQLWTLVEPSERVKPIGCKWVLKKKIDMDGNVQTYKGRLVAKAEFHDYEIWKMDVKTTFLNGELEEDVYMRQPEGFVTPKNAGKVRKLQRSIYGLKQASRS